MTDGLSDADWLALEHAYGSAEDVPGMLRELVGADADARRGARQAAYGNIFHQGTRYPATPPAIAFLVAALADPATPERGELLELLVACVAGYFGPTYGPVTGSGAIWGLSAPLMEADGETPELLAACERAAAPALPVLLELLGAVDKRLRVRAPWLLAALWAHADRTVVRARIEQRRAIERDPFVRAMLAFALTHLCDPGEGALHGVFAGDVSKLARLLAAMGCVRRGEATPDMARALVAWLADPALAADYQHLPFGQELAGDLGRTQARLDAPLLAEAFPLLVDRLRVVKDFSATGLLEAALTCAYGRDAAAPARRWSPRASAAGGSGPQPGLLVTGQRAHPAARARPALVARGDGRAIGHRGEARRGRGGAHRCARHGRLRRGARPHRLARGAGGVPR